VREGDARSRVARASALASESAACRPRAVAPIVGGGGHASGGAQAGAAGEHENDDGDSDDAHHEDGADALGDSGDDGALVSPARA
jgi:hypothetical protein